ncbi:dihydroxy-acid dehydratase [Rhodobacteraceae bacterium KN286]|uniref:Dihydroxy-acid dehydratase n=2 Tax=Oceanomicrobium pacificus TaxID=2692916 RepID=A0A6B0TTA8_9RHOB|nr:dihydroxy-acid dehydratase [Oceanomicrobium pacificus]
MGLSEEDLLKPKIAVVNSSSKLSVCFQHLDGVSETVQAAIRDAGGVPFEIRTVAPSDFITSAGRQGRYLMPTRDLLVNDVEVQVEGAELDGMILLSSCDKTTPAHLMAAGRLDIPALILTCGYQLGGDCAGRHVDIETLYNSVGALKAGQIDLADLKAMSCQAITGPGVCAGLATANSMHVTAEALGMTVPGNAPIRAGSDRLADYARKAGTRIVQMVDEGLTARKVLTPAAFHNAVTVAIALGCSVNVVRHLIASAIEAEADFDVLAAFDRLGRDLPQITQVRPNGPTRIEELDAAGGCRGAMVQLRDRLDLAAMTASGQRLGDVLDAAPAPDATVIRPLADPFRPDPGLLVLKGSLAPDGAIVKLSAVPGAVRRFSGPARVFEDESEAIAGLGDGSISKGDVIVLRMLGPKGGPGTVFAASFMAALVGAGLGADVAVVTDGELSGLNSGITVGQVMPEAAEGGPLAVVRDGDTITIDMEARSLDLGLEAPALSDRLAALDLELSEERPGWLRFYRDLVQPLSKGAVLGTR